MYIVVDAKNSWSQIGKKYHKLPIDDLYFVWYVIPDVGLHLGARLDSTYTPSNINQSGPFFNKRDDMKFRNGFISNSSSSSFIISFRIYKNKDLDKQKSFESLKKMFEYYGAKLNIILQKDMRDFDFYLMELDVFNPLLDSLKKPLNVLLTKMDASLMASCNYD